LIVEFPLAGQQGGHDNKQFSSEEMRHVYISAANTNGILGVHNFPGLKLRTSGAGNDRGDTVMAGVRYVINGTTLYKESIAGLRTSLGTVNGSDRAIFSNDGTNLYFTAGGVIYKYDGSALTTVTQSVVTNPSSISYTNVSFIITGDDGRYAVSDAGDGDTYNALNFAEAEFLPDSLVLAYVFSGLIYLAGSKSIELHRYTGSGNPPISRQDTALVNVGIAGKHAITNSDRYLYWLDDERKFYKCIGASYDSIDTSGIAHIVSEMSNVSDCIASSFNWKGQVFVLFSFPSAGKNLLYSETNNYWTVLSSGTDSDRFERWYGNAVTYCYDKFLVTDYRNGNTYELDADTYTDNSDSVLHAVTPRTFTGKDIGHTGRVTATQMFIDMQVGVGLASGQGSDPVLMCEYSSDGGQNWGPKIWVPVGIGGDFTKRVQFDDFANGYQIKPRISWTDPVPITMWSGTINLVAAGY
jgi:hypothetical protein